MGAGVSGVVCGAFGAQHFPTNPLLSPNHFIVEFIPLNIFWAIIYDETYPIRNETDKHHLSNNFRFSLITLILCPISLLPLITHVVTKIYPH